MAGSYTSALLDALISDVSTGPITFTVDIGNDGTWDWQITQNVTGPTALASPNLASAFNQYWSAHGSPTSGMLDVPIKVALNTSGQVLITNLLMLPAQPSFAQSLIVEERYADK
jgi:hypothetical protein